METKYINRLNSIASRDGSLFLSNSPLGSFLERYLVCEAIARTLITLKSGSDCPHAISFRQIESAVNYFSINNQFSINLISLIFRSGKGIRGQNTPRQLRNSIVHGLSESSCCEAVDRYDQLMLLMSEWISKFRMD